MYTLKTYALNEIVEMKLSRETLTFYLFDHKTAKYYTVVFDTARVILHSIRGVVVCIYSGETLGMVIDYKV
jgi:hypothetical protein